MAEARRCAGEHPRIDRGPEDPVILPADAERPAQHVVAPLVLQRHPQQGLAGRARQIGHRRGERPQQRVASPGRRVGGIGTPGEFGERERVAGRQGEDPPADPFVQSGAGPREHLGRLHCVEGPQGEVVSLHGVDPPGHRRTGGDDQAHRVVGQAGHREGEGLRGRRVEPVRVVHDHEQRPLRDDAGEQGDKAHIGRETVRGDGRPQPQRRPQRVEARARVLLQGHPQRGEQLREAGERELRLGVHRRHPQRPDA